MSDAILQGISQGITDSNATLNTISNNVQGLKDPIDGINAKIQKELLTKVIEVPSYMQKVYEQLAASGIPGISSIEKLLKEFTGSQSKKDTEDKAKTNKTLDQPGGKDWTIDKLASAVPVMYAAPAIMLGNTLNDLLGEKSLLIETLTSLKNAIVPVIEGLKTVDLKSKKEDKKVGEAEGTGGGGGGFKAPSAAELKAFEASMKQLGFIVDGIRDVFIDKKTGQAKLSKEEVEKIRQAVEGIELLKQAFVKLAETMGAALRTFTMTLMIAVLIIPAIIVLAFILVFLALSALLGVFAAWVLPYITAFAITVIQISIAMILLAVVLLLITLIINPGLIKKVLITMVSIAIILISVALLIIPAMIAAVGAAFLLVAAALLFVAFLFLALAFLLAWAIITIIQKEPLILLIGIFLLPFFLGIILLWPILVTVALTAFLLAITGILLFIAFLFLTLAILLAWVMVIILTKNPMIMLIGIFLFPFFLGITLLQPLLVYTVISAFLLAITGILLFIAFLFLTLAVLLALAVTAIIFKNPKLLVIGFVLFPFFMGIVVLGLISIYVALACIPLLIASVLLLAIFIALTLTLLLAMAVTKLVEKIDAPKMREGILQLFDVVMNPKLIFKAIMVAITAGPILVASVMLLLIFSAIAGAYKAISKLKEFQDKAPDPTMVFAAVEQLADIAKKASEKMEGSSKKALNLFKIGIGAITEAIALIVDTIIKIGREFTGPKGQENLALATEGLDTILTKFFGVSDGEPAEGSLMAIFSGMPKISKGQLRATEALVPLTQAIDQITDTVIKVANVGTETDIPGALNILDQIKDFVAGLQKFAEGFSGGFFGIGDSSKKVKAAVKATDEMLPLIDNLEKIGNKAAGFDEIKFNIEEFVLEPLLRLEEPIQKIKEVSNAIKSLNSELSKLAKDNKDTLKAISNINNSSAQGLSTFIAKLPSVFKKDVGTPGSPAQNNVDNPLITIAKDVRGIAQHLLRNNSASWTEEPIRGNR